MNYAVEMGSVAMIWYKKKHVVHSKSHKDYCVEQTTQKTPFLYCCVTSQCMA
jgi:hypothetical protein